MAPHVFCSSFYWGDISFIDLEKLFFKAYVVAGGLTDGFYSPISSVLTLLPGAPAWTPLASLPRQLRYAPASIVGGKIRLTGGVDAAFSIRSEVIIEKCSMKTIKIHCFSILTDS